jgi:hypothetical protein
MAGIGVAALELLSFGLFQNVGAHLLAYYGQFFSLGAVTDSMGATRELHLTTYRGSSRLGGGVNGVQLLVGYLPAYPRR